MPLSQDERDICQEYDRCITSERMTSWLMRNKGELFQSLITHAISVANLGILYFFGTLGFS